VRGRRVGRGEAGRRERERERDEEEKRKGDQRKNPRCKLKHTKK
jgi:hypothetical protein